MVATGFLERAFRAAPTAIGSGAIPWQRVSLPPGPPALGIVHSWSPYVEKSGQAEPPAQAITVLPKVWLRSIHRRRIPATRSVLERVGPAQGTLFVAEVSKEWFWTDRCDPRPHWS